ncbi:hypothetical protein [Calidifontibacter terrae]
MTLSSFPEPVVPLRYVHPGRSGEPWTEDDYEQLVEMCRGGVGSAAVAKALQRSESPLIARAKKLLPLAERGVPTDLVFAHLRRLLQDDAGYDWRRHLAELPPPRPVVNNILPPPLHAGIPGLTDAQLVAIAYALSWAPEAGVSADVAGAVAGELVRRDLVQAVRSRLERDAEERVDDLLERSTGGARWSRPYW